MAITGSAAGAWAASNATTQTVTLPAHATGDMLILITACKAATIPTTITITTATGWTAFSTFNDGTTASGVGTGSVQQTIFYKIATSNAETNPVVNWGATSTPGIAVAQTFTKAANETWDIPVAVAKATNASTSISVTMNSNPGITVGDVGIVIHTIADDSALTVPSWSATGTTLSAVTEFPATAIATTTSNDMAGDTGYRTVTAGTASVAPTVTGTAAAAETGSSAFVRLRVLHMGSGQAQALIKVIGNNRPAQANASNELSYQVAVLNTSGVVAYWRLNDSSATRIPDYKNSNMGTYNGGVTFNVTSPIIADSDARAITLDGSTGYIRFPDSNTLDVGDTFTLEAFVKRNTLGVDKHILFKAGVAYSWFITAANKVQLDDDATVAARTSATITDTDWHYLVVTHDSGGTKIYIDGEDQALEASNTVVFTNTTGVVNIGAYGSGPSGNFWNDSIDEVAIYNVVLSKATVQSHMIASGRRSIPAAQAQATIIRITPQPAQAQARIIRISSQPAQAQASVLAIQKRTGYAQGLTSRTNTQLIDTGTRAVSNDWGTPDTGPDWSVAYTNTPSRFSVTSGKLQFTGTGVSDLISQPLLYLNDLEIVYDFTLSLAAASSGHQIRFDVRSNQTITSITPHNGYSLGILLFNDGNAYAVIRRYTNSGLTVIEDSSVILLSGLVASTTYRTKYQILTSSNSSKILFKVKVWNPTGSEPEWTTFEDTSPSVLGLVGGGIRTFLSTIGATTLTLDNVNINPTINGGSGQAQATIVLKQTRAHQAAGLVNGTYTLPFADEFNRSVTDGVGTSDNGDTWVYVSGTAANADVDGSNLTLVTAAAGVTTIYDLQRTLIQSYNGYEWLISFKIDKIPAVSYVISLATVNSSISVSPPTGTGIRVQINSDSTATLGYTWKNSTGGGTPKSFSAGTFYYAKVHVIKSAGGTTGIFRAKLWVVGDAEPGWDVDSTATGVNGPVGMAGTIGHPRISAAGSNDANAPFTVTYDFIRVTEAWIGRYAQAQAFITAGTTQSGQAQADIKNTYYGLGQSQADIKTTYPQVAQAQAGIKAVGFGLGQAQGRIKNTYFALGQAQADIKQTYFALAQSQADIKQTYSQCAQAQVDIKATSYALGQAEAVIVGQRRYAQAQALLNTGFARAQSTGLINGTYFVPFEDTFTRSVSNDLGTSDNGDTWTKIQGTNSDVSVNGTQAVLVTNQTTISQWALYNTLLKRNNGLEFYTEINWNKTPSTNYNVIIGIQYSTKATGNLFPIQFSTGITSGNIVAGASIGGVGFSNTILSNNPVNTYAIKVQITPTSNNSTSLRYKAWVIGTDEPGWAQNTGQTITQPLNNPGGHPQIYLATYTNAGDRPITITLNTLKISEASWGLYGQAQARIKAVTFQSGQAQAYILALRTETAQAQADIQTTYYALAQAQAQIKTTNYSVAQAQAQIKQTYFALAQAQANIKQTYFALGQAQADVKTTYYGLGQAQADIKATSSQCAQSQADIKNTYFGLGQAQADIKAVGYGSGQAQADIKQTYYQVAQSQADIKNTYFGLGQSQADIKAVGYGSGQAQSDIKTTYTQSGQSQADIKNTYYGLGQANADIKATSYALGQAQALITDTYEQCAQAQANIKAVGYGLGQSQADILATSYGLGQAQSDIKNTYFGSGQANADILATDNAFGQAQADIQNTYFGLGQANAYILVVTYQSAQAEAYIINGAAQWAQAQAFVITPGFNSANAQADIKQTYTNCAQAQGHILNTYFGSGQANADILASSTQSGQSQADILATPTQSGQSQADILATYTQSGNAQADIKATAVTSGQAQADIQAIYYQSGQSQSWIEATYNQHAQSQADIKQTYYASAQAQADIKATSTQSAQANADILATSTQSGNAQATILATYYGSGQANANIKAQGYGIGNAQADIKATDTQSGQAQGTVLSGTNQYGQSAGSIRNTYTNCANANADIRTTYSNSGNANAAIRTTNTESAQAAANVKAITYASGQAQASIKTTNNGYGQAQSDIKASYTQSAQALATVATRYEQSAQSQTYITGINYQNANAQANIKTTANAFGQAQSDVKQTYVNCAQANADIKQTYQVSAQTQAYIVARHYENAQAQAQIKQTYTQSSQAQGSIKQTYAQFAQAQGIIKQTYQVFAQSQAQINAAQQSYGQALALISTAGIVYGQAQANINATTNVYAQTQAFISKLAGYAQAQAWIRQDRIIHNLEVSDRHSINLALVDVGPIALIEDRPDVEVELSDHNIQLSLSDQNIKLELSDSSY